MAQDSIQFLSKFQMVGDPSTVRELSCYLNMVILIELLNNYTIEINKVISNIG